MGENTTAATRVSESADTAAMLDPDYALLPVKISIGVRKYFMKVVIHCKFLCLAPLQNSVKENIISIFFNSLLSKENINIFKWKRTH